MNGYTPETLWHVEIRTDYRLLEALVNMLEGIGVDALSWYECEDSAPSMEEDDQGFPISQYFIVEGYSKTQFPLGLLEEDLDMIYLVFDKAGFENKGNDSSDYLTSASSANVSKDIHIQRPYIQSCKPVDHQDWLQVCYNQLSPKIISEFFIYGSHNKDIEIPQGLTPLQVDAATAFGSGDHQTTSGCLQTIRGLQKQNYIFNSILDMGCGSGILAIAAAKTWPQAKVLAVDNDPESVKVTAYNKGLNNTPQVEELLSFGFENLKEDAHGSFDLILANILANPLRQMAGDMAKFIKPNGFVVLSGLLERQKADVLKSYEDAGFCLSGEKSIDNWVTLLMQKS